MEKSEPQEAEKEGSACSQDSSADKHKPLWICRQDVIAWLAGLVFIAILVTLMFVIGGARGWDAQSGKTHYQVNNSQLRFLPEPNGSDASALWYYWKLPPQQATALTRLFMWLSYCGHQVSIWVVIYLAQSAKSETPPGKGRYSTDMNVYNWVSWGLNAFFHLMHLLNTHTTYDALAQDVTIASSQGSVIMLINFVVVMEYRERGLFFGWPSVYNNDKHSRRVRLNYEPINLMRKYHGYAFAWAAIYTFWYHPMENTIGHAMGFIYTWLIMLHGSLMYTEFHKNVYMRVFIEVFVVIHGGVVAYQTGSGPNRDSLWPMFVFGFLMVFCITQIFSLPFWRKIPWWCRFLPIVLYLALVTWCYSWIRDAQGRAWTRMQEIIRIPGVYYIYSLITWALLYLFLFIEKKIYKDQVNESACSQTGRLANFIAAIFMFAICVAISVISHVIGGGFMLFVQMLVFQFIFVIVVGISMMFLKRAVPRWKKGAEPTEPVKDVSRVSPVCLTAYKNFK